MASNKGRYKKASTMTTRKKTDYIFIHCSATKPSMYVGAAEIDKWHRKRGWLGIGYHAVIRRDGTLEYGRDLEEPGAHVRGYNDRSIGIVLIGGLNEETGEPEDNFTLSQKYVLRDFIKHIKQNYYPEAEVKGHNSVANKACPCFDVEEFVQQYGL